MKLRLLFIACFWSLSAHAQNCPDLFPQDYGLLTKWGLSESQTDQLAASGHTALVHGSLQAIRLIESAPLNFYRFSRIILPYIQLVDANQPESLNPLSRSRQLTRPLWMKMGFSALAALVQRTDPEWHAEHLGSPNLEAMDLIATAGATVSPLVRMERDSLEDHRADLSIDRIFDQDQLSGEQLANVILKTPFIRNNFLNVITPAIFERLSDRPGTWEEIQIVHRFVDWHLKPMGPPPYLPVDLSAHARLVIDWIDAAFTPDRMKRAQDVLNPIFQAMGLISSTATQASLIVQSLDLIAAVRRSVVLQVHGVDEHLPIFFAASMAAHVPAEWPSPQKIKEKLSLGLRLQLEELNETAL